MCSSVQQQTLNEGGEDENVFSTRSLDVIGRKVILVCEVLAGVYHIDMNR
jgi:hypothetical protein